MSWYDEMARRGQLMMEGKIPPGETLEQQLARMTRAELAKLSRPPSPRSPANDR